MQQAETMAQFKAYSQNMGHETTEVTERYYSRFARKDVKRIVTGKVKEGAISEMDEDTLKEFREFQAFMKWKQSDGKF